MKAPDREPSAGRNQKLTDACGPSWRGFSADESVAMLRCALGSRAQSAGQDMGGHVTLMRFHACRRIEY